jgi:Icc-related predicted phosphoesterase
LTRIAAAGDLHAGRDSVGTIAPQFDGIDEVADALLLAGDLTQRGDPAEAEILGAELRDVHIPIVAVLGNHDHHSDRPEEVRAVLEVSGLVVLEEEGCELPLDGTTVGIAGAKGFCGGFEGASGTEFGEPEMKAFIRHTREGAEATRVALDGLSTDLRLMLLHYAPVRATLEGERTELFPFLGSYLLGEAADRAGASLVLHGHAHNGTENGLTRGGIQVRNVAQPVLRRGYAVYERDGDAWRSAARG